MYCIWWVINVWINSDRSGLWIGEWLCYWTVVFIVVVIITIIIIIISKQTYDNIPEWKIPWQIVHNWNFHATFTVNCISKCGNIYCTPQNHAPHNRLSVMCEMWGCDSGAAEYSSILLCYTVSFGVTFRHF